MNRQEFNERIQKEFEKFRVSTLNLTQDEIFENSSEIAIKAFLTMHLQDEETVSDKVAETLNEIEGGVLDILYLNYIENNGDFVFYDLSEDIIASYLEFTNFKNDEDIDKE